MNSRLLIALCLVAAIAFVAAEDKPAVDPIPQADDKPAELDRDSRDASFEMNEGKHERVRRQWGMYGMGYPMMGMGYGMGYGMYRPWGMYGMWRRPWGMWG